eukprot:246125-Pelagomonas_calceolata.AAC.1
MLLYSLTAALNQGTAMDMSASTKAHKPLNRKPRTKSAVGQLQMTSCASQAHMLTFVFEPRSLYADWAHLVISGSKSKVTCNLPSPQTLQIRGDATMEDFAHCRLKEEILFQGLRIVLILPLRIHQHLT